MWGEAGWTSLPLAVPQVINGCGHSSSSCSRPSSSFLLREWTQGSLEARGPGASESVGLGRVLFPLQAV